MARWVNGKQARTVADLSNNQDFSWEPYGRDWKCVAAGLFQGRDRFITHTDPYGTTETILYDKNTEVWTY